MACTITIPFWPESVDCLSWSADNQIAVTGGEHIAILTPKLNKDLNSSLWATSLIKVNAFTSRELPLRDPPLRNAIFSIGEDLSQRQAIEAKWSPPGLARHQRCALAVLTANHVLSIWAPNGRSHDAESWQRQVIVNHAVADYYASAATRQQRGNSEQQQYEHREICQRIRAFAWSPCLIPSRRELGERHFYLAVSTEGGDVLYLRLSSPYRRSYTRDQGWAVTVIGSLHLGTHTRPLVDDVDEGIPFASNLCWDRWSWEEQEHYVSRFAYILSGRLFTTPIKTNMKEITVGTNRLHIRERNDVSGPLRFAPGSSDAPLIAFGEDAVFQVDVNAEADNYLSHHLDGRWDSVSGVAFAYPGSHKIDVHVTSVLSMAATSTTMSAAPTTTLRLPLEKAAISIQPAWQRAIADSKAAYGANLNVDDQVLVRTLGIANSPVGDYIATCSTMHPADCIAYVIGSDQVSVLNIGLENDCGGASGIVRGQQSSSTEALLYSLSHSMGSWAEKHTSLESGVSLSAYSPFVQDIARRDDQELLHDQDSTPAGLYHRLVRLFEQSNPIQRVQTCRIVDLAFKQDKSRHESFRELVTTLVREVLDLPFDGGIDELSDKIRTIYTMVAAQLDLVKQSTAAPSSPGAENCRICQQPIPFESLKWSRCSSGHQYTRCALSFLSIDQPGTARKCGICDSQYLKPSIFSKAEAATRDVEMVDIPDADTGPHDTWVDISLHPNALPQRARTLAQIMFAACEHCIYCGGHFVD